MSPFICTYIYLKNYLSRINIVAVRSWSALISLIKRTPNSAYTKLRTRLVYVKYANKQNKKPYICGHLYVHTYI